MIVEYIRYRIDPQDAEEFEAAYARASVPLAAAPQCRDYELSRCVDEPSSYILRIRWTSADDHMRGSGAASTSRRSSPRSSRTSSRSRRCGTTG